MDPIMQEYIDKRLLFLEVVSRLQRVVEVQMGLMLSIFQKQFGNHISDNNTNQTVKNNTEHDINLPIENTNNSHSNNNTEPDILESHANIIDQPDSTHLGYVVS